MGYPDGSDPKGRGSRPPAGRGHGSIKANVMVVALSFSATAGSTSSSTLFTPDQRKALAGRFGSNKLSDERLSGTFLSTSWIIDSGATYHVTGNIDFYV